MMTKKRQSLTWISYMNTKQFLSLWWQVGGGGRGSLSTSVTLVWATAETSAVVGSPELRINYFEGRFRSLLCCTLKCSSCNDVTIRSVKDCQLIKLTRKSERHGIQRCVTDYSWFHNIILTTTLQLQQGFIKMKVTTVCMEFQT